MELRGFSEERIRQTIVEFRAAHDEIVRLWRNDYRFASEAQIRGWLRVVGAYYGTKGDVLKANARRLLVAAQTILNTGVLLWTSKRK